MRDGPPREQAVHQDRTKHDAAPRTCNPSTLGKACTPHGNECGQDNTCLLVGAAIGVCTCKCVPDDPQSPHYSEDNCPKTPESHCVRVQVKVTASNIYQLFRPPATVAQPRVVHEAAQDAKLCLPTCTPRLDQNDCAPGLACNLHVRWHDYVNDTRKATCAAPACTLGQHCPVVTSTPCNGCGADGAKCTSFAQLNCPPGQFCMTFLAGDEGRCALPGNCSPASGLGGELSSGKASAKIGDPCKDDTECGGNMRCMQEFDRAKYQKKEGEACTREIECCSGICSNGTCTRGPCTVEYRGGYCVITDCDYAVTLPSRACPSGSACNDIYAWDFGAICQKSCSLNDAATCRGNPGDFWGDYDCRQWNKVSPVCDFGVAAQCCSPQFYPCMGGTTRCSSLGSTCRFLDGTIAPDPLDPFAFCLDDTASGAQYRSNPRP